MCTNSSSSLPQNLPLDLDCLLSSPSSFIFTAYVAALTLFLLPISTFILWRMCFSSSISHSDAITFHHAIMELGGVSGSIVATCAIFACNINMIFTGGFMFSFGWYGQIFFHLLTCMERHLAVVHPVTYRSLRSERGVRIRNISIGSVWLLTIMGTVMVQRRNLATTVLAILSFSVFIIIFCSFSALCVLIRPGPGKQGGTRERLDPSKTRALHTLVVILAVLVMRLVGNLLWAEQYLFKEEKDCLLLVFVFWMNLPSALVLPMLFLYRTRELPCCNNSQ